MTEAKYTPRLHPDLPLAARFLEAAVAKLPELAKELERWYADGRDGGWHNLPAPGDLHVRLHCDAEGSGYVDVYFRILFDRRLETLPWTKANNRLICDFEFENLDGAGASPTTLMAHGELCIAAAKLAKRMEKALRHAAKTVDMKLSPGAL